MASCSGGGPRATHPRWRKWTPVRRAVMLRCAAPPRRRGPARTRPRDPVTERGGDVATRDLAASDPLSPHSLAPRELKDLLAARRRGEPFLAFRGGEEELVLVALGREDGTRTLGRRPEMDVPIPWDGEVSGLHA